MIPTFEIQEDSMELVSVLVESGALPSRGEVKRRVSQGAVKIDKLPISNFREIVVAPCIIKYGKRSFLKCIK